MTEQNTPAIQIDDRIAALEHDMAETAHCIARTYEIATDIANSEPSEFYSIEFIQKARDLVAAMDELVEGIA